MTAETPQNISYNIFVKIEEDFGKTKSCRERWHGKLGMNCYVSLKYTIKIFTLQYLLIQTEYYILKEDFFQGAF